MSFSKVLIANRGEIAVRVMASCARLGIKTVAVFSEADHNAPFVAMADEAVCIGPAEARKSYLDIDAIIGAAQTVGAEAIHPGYGFLAENAEFAERVAAAGLNFIGPKPEAIRVMGLKPAAKDAAIAAGVPVIPGYHGDEQSVAKLRKEAAKVGFPLLIKASAGGGGRGMRLVSSLDGFDEALSMAQREAKTAFGDSLVFLERFVPHARHVEVQVLGDRHGGMVHLFERDCSIQRNNQKLIEEAPAPNIPDPVRAQLHAAAISLARAIGYDSAGTVEFIYDAAREEFFFLEMNTRLQVEHPVTEMITGIDLVALQIRLASGEALPFAQENVHAQGWAVEARVAAENPEDDFRPETGRVSAHVLPHGSGLRVDSGIAVGSEVSHYYDSMLSKVIAHGPTRETAIARLRAGLTDYRISGVGTNSSFLLDVLAQDAFIQARHHTGALGEMFPKGWRRRMPDARARAEAALSLHLAAENRGAETESRLGPWGSLGGWRMVEPSGYPGGAVYYVAAAGEAPAMVHVRGRAGRYLIEPEDGDALAVSGAALADRQLVYEVRQGDTPVRARAHVDIDHMDIAGRRVSLRSERGLFDVGVLSPEAMYLSGSGETEAGSGDEVMAPMPGAIAEIKVAPKQQVEKGQPLVVLEAMKLMQNLIAPRAGEVSEVLCAVGETVASGAILLRLKEE